MTVKNISGDLNSDIYRQMQKIVAYFPKAHSPGFCIVKIKLTGAKNYAATNLDFYLANFSILLFRRSVRLGIDIEKVQ